MFLVLQICVFVSLYLKFGFKLKVGVAKSRTFFYLNKTSNNIPMKTQVRNRSQSEMCARRLLFLFVPAHIFFLFFF